MDIKYRVILLALIVFVVFPVQSSPVEDAMRCPALRDVRLLGYPGEKLNAVFCRLDFLDRSARQKYVDEYVLSMSGRCCGMNLVV